MKAREEKQIERVYLHCYEKTCMWNKKNRCSSGVIQIGNYEDGQAGFSNHSCDSYKYKISYRKE